MCKLLKDWIWEKFDDSISYEIVRDLPDNLMYAFGALANASFLSFLLVFIITGYNNSIQSDYLVPQGNNDPGVCEDVAKALPNGGYYQDTAGTCTFP